MKTLLVRIVLLFTFSSCFAQGEFYREYWAEFDENISNHKDGRWRVNDESLSLHEKFGKRREALANGLMLINVPEDLFLLKSTELYLELWGGHGKTANKRLILNGKDTYYIPLTGTEEGHETYSYPAIPLKVRHLVTGVNAVQFACDREAAFWGHFIIDNACVRCVLKPDHPSLQEAGLKDLRAIPAVKGDKVRIADTVQIFLVYDKKFEDNIESVDYYGHYLGFDDTGNRQEDDWHGFTFDRNPVNHLGTALEPPFQIDWDTGMLPDQGKPMVVRATVHFKNGLKYRTPVLHGLELNRKKSVKLYRCTEMPVPFHSRASREAIAKFYLPDDLSKLERAQLCIKTWDGGEGTVREPFTINGHAYRVISGQHIHDVVFTVTDMELSHLKAGENEIRLFSDTEHHGIEILLPGPCFILEYRK